MIKFGALRSLRHRNFRLYFFGQGVSLIGTWMTRLATSWLVYRLTGSSLLLGVVSFAGQIPTFLLAPFAGVWADRWEKRRLLIVTQILAAAQSLALAGLTLSHHITIPLVVGLSILQGLINAFDVPARQAFTVQMVNDRADLGNAIALNSTLVNGARLLGPALAGLVIAAVGEGYCFLIDGLSYFGVIVSLLAMRLDLTVVKKPATRMLHELKEGWSYVSNSPPIWSLLVLFALISLMGIPFTVLMPAFASTILHGGPNTLGLLSGASGLGSVIATLSLAARRSDRELYKVIPSAAALMGAGLIGFSFSRNLGLSMALMAVTGYGVMQDYAASSTVLQNLVHDDKRGRVMGYWTMAYMGASPFGSLLAGSLAPILGVPGTILLCGVGCLGAGGWFWLQFPKLRAALAEPAA